MRLLCFVFLFYSGTLFGGTLELEIYPPYPMKGEALSLVVKSDEPLQMVESFPEIENWRSGNGIRRGSQSVNGVSSYYFIGQYLPEKEGEFTIPSFKVKVNGKVQNTPEKKVKILPNKTTDDKDKIIITEILYNGKEKMPEKIYPGVVFTVDYKVSVVRGWRYLDHDVLYDYRPQIEAKDLSIKRHRGFMENRDYEEIDEHKIVDGIPYSTKVYRYKLSPMKSGSYDFNIKQHIYALKKIRGIPRNKTQEKDVNIQNTLNVIPIPPPPANVYFLEIAGKWKVDAKLTKSEAKTGHTFEMILYINGSEGDIERVKAPELKLPGFEVDPKPEIEHHSRGAIIKYSMRALRKTSFPQITFATFNHLEEKFERFPVNLDIDVTGDDILVDKSAEQETQSQENKESDAPKLKTADYSVARPLYFNISPLWYLISLTLPLSYLGIIWFYRRAEMGQKEVDVKKEAVNKLKGLCVKLESSSEADFFDKELLPWLAQAYELPPGATADELAAKIEDKELAALIKNSSHQSFLPGNQQKLNNSLLADKLKKSLLALMVFFMSFSLSADDSMVRKSYNNGDYYAAVKGYKELIKNDDSNPAYYYNLGLAQLSLEKYAESLASLETASRLSPADPEIRNKVIFVRNKLQV
ncbi:MAG: BatD family protein, partial [Lentisphaeraceae bacterium]|nr:BatD family protein [Lentisphaeraceae bacterium]